MELEHARELKTELLASDAVRAVAATPGTWLAIGLAARTAGDGVQLAVRFERRASAHDAALERIQDRAGGEVDLRETGRIEPFQSPPELQARVRPLHLGLSIGHFRITAGTLGGFVRPQGGADRGLRLLSNNHVLADEDRAQVGDPVLQPGPADGGRPPEDRVGTFERAVRLRSDAPNQVDCALAVLEAGVDANVTSFGALGSLGGVVDDPSTVQSVAKIGRTTGLTRGRISAFELDDLRVDYDRGTLRFDNQLEIEGDAGQPFSQGGDSGSLIVTPTRPRAVGLLFAGSETGGPGGAGLTFANPIAAVLSALQIEFAT